MPARNHILTLILLACCLAARGQDLRTDSPLSDGQYLAAGEYLAWLDGNGDVLRMRPLDRTLAVIVESNGHLYAIDTEGRELIGLDQDGRIDYIRSMTRNPSSMLDAQKAAACEVNVFGIPNADGADGSLNPSLVLTPGVPRQPFLLLQLIRGDERETAL